MNDYSTSLPMLQAISNTPTIPFARVPWNEPGIIMRMLDAGTCGIIAPMISTKEECEKFVSYCRYPPLGQRSFGPMRAQLKYGADYYQKANDSIITLAMVETQEAINNIESDEEEIKELYEAVEKGFLSKWIPLLPKNPDRQVKGSEYHPNQSLFNLIRPCPDLPSPTITQQGQQKGLSGVIHYEHDRKLTIPELKRVQGLPEDFEVTGTFNQRAERIGRMVAPKCIAALATSVYNKVLSYD